MAISTYAELQTAVANWLDRSDLTTRIPEFIELAEAEFNRRIRTLDNTTIDTAFTVDSIRETVPTNYLGVKSMMLNRTPAVGLRFMTPDKLAAQRQRFTSSGIPIYFTVVGGSFEFLPTPNDSYTATLVYYERIPDLATNSTNWLLTSHPDLYLFGTLKAAEPYIQNDERLPVWAAQYEAALGQLDRQDERASRGIPTTRGRSFG